MAASLITRNFYSDFSTRSSLFLRYSWNLCPLSPVTGSHSALVHAVFFCNYSLSLKIYCCCPHRVAQFRILGSFAGLQALVN